MQNAVILIKWEIRKYEFFFHIQNINKEIMTFDCNKIKKRKFHY